MVPIQEGKDRAATSAQFDVMSFVDDILQQTRQLHSALWKATHMGHYIVGVILDL